MKYPSRAREVNVETCITKAGGNKFDLILIAAAKARKIKSENFNSTDLRHQHPAITALLEIQNGEVLK